MEWSLEAGAATGTLQSPNQHRSFTVRGGRHEIRDDTLISRLNVDEEAWTALVVGVDTAVVAAPTTSLPEAPGHDRQFDYRYTWLRDASVSTAVAALLGKGDDARRYLEFVHAAWGDEDLLTQPLRTVRGGPAPDEREVPDVAGWAGSRPVRVGTGASGQRQYDSLGLFAEAVSVYVEVGGRLDEQTWPLVRRLARPDHRGRPACRPQQVAHSQRRR